MVSRGQRLRGAPRLSGDPRLRPPWRWHLPAMETIDHTGEPRPKLIIQPEICAKMKAVVDLLYPHFQVLNGGPSYSQRPQSFQAMGRTSTRTGQEDAGASATIIYLSLAHVAEPRLPHPCL